MPINIALFKNDRKENENQPDYQGFNKETGDSAAGWNKVSKRGDEYISLRFETKAEKEAQMANIKKQVADPSPKPAMDSFDDEILF